jgi:hypothetical protein
MVAPPSTTTVWPLMKELAFEARNTAAPAISSGSPMRASGVVAVTAFRVCGFSHSASEVGPDQAGRDAVYAHIMPTPFDREVAGKLKVRRFRDIKGPMTDEPFSPEPSPHFFVGQNATGGWCFDAASLV